jgi:hypothetical protein
LNLFRAGHALGAALIALGLGDGGVKAAEEGALHWRWAVSEDFCDKTCALTFYGGKFLHTEMVHIFAQGDFTPIWDWTYEDSTLFASTFSRRVGSFGRFIDVEAELGAAKRFGLAKDLEIWAVLYFRWKYFPWNNYLRTTIAVPTGFNWASAIPEIERIRALDKTGRQLLHFFSPEVTFGLPSHPDWDLMLRIHHRSGWVFFPIGGGAQYFTIGLRHHF